MMKAPVSTRKHLQPLSEEQRPVFESTAKLITLPTESHTVAVGTRLVLYVDTTLSENELYEGRLTVYVEGELEVRRTLRLLGRAATTKLTITGMVAGQGRITVADEVFLQAPEAQADVRTRLVLKDKAKSEVRGRLVVERSAIKSKASERLDHLLIGDQVSASGIPELEVETDDITCSHAATTSRPSEATMFYLMSRGLDRESAEQVVCQGFLNVC